MNSLTPIVAIYARSRDPNQPAEIQIAHCAEHVLAQGWKLGPVFSDTTSSLAHRPGLLRMKEAAASGTFSILVMHDMSRLSRNLNETIALFDMFRATGIRIWTAEAGFVAAGNTIAVRAMKALGRARHRESAKKTR